MDLFLILGIFLIFGSLALYFKTQKIISNGFKTEGIIIDYEECKDPDGGSSTYKPIVKFKLPNGETKRTTIDLAYVKYKNKTLPIIYYNNGKEEKTIINTYFGKYICVLLLFGIIFTTVSLIEMQKGNNKEHILLDSKHYSHL